MQRRIAPLPILYRCFGLWWLLRRLKPDMTEFSTPKAGLLGTVAAMLAACHGASICCAGSGWKLPAGLNAAFCWQRSGWPQPVRT